MLLRRNFITGLGAALAMPFVKEFAFAGDSAGSSGIVKPKALKQSDIVGVIAPGTAVTDPDDLARLKEALDYFGLKMKMGRNVLKGTGYKSRAVKERADDLNELFSDKEVKAVMSIRGGYGAAQLLPYIDFDNIRKNPKIFTGYSDITALHIAIHQRTGLVTFHSPMWLASFTNYTINYFKKAIFSCSPIGEIINPDAKSGLRAVHPVRTVVKGKARGRLTGGNLSLISALMGTEYEINVDGKLLFIEDVDEEPYRIDRMLTQLKLAGKFDKAAGIVFGECNGCNTEKLKPSQVWDLSLGEVIDNELSDLKIPVFYGLTIGHTADQATLPLGVEAEIDADKGVLNITEAAAL